MRRLQLHWERATKPYTKSPAARPHRIAGTVDVELEWVVVDGFQSVIGRPAKGARAACLPGMGARIDGGRPLCFLQQLWRLKWARALALRVAAPHRARVSWRNSQWGIPVWAAAALHNSCKTSRASGAQAPEVSHTIGRKRMPWDSQVSCVPRWSRLVCM